MKEAIEAFMDPSEGALFKPKAVLFDMDGVLFDSMKFHATAWTQVMNELGLKFDRHDAFMNEGRTGASTVNEFMKAQWNREATKDEVEAIYEKKTELFKTYGIVPPVLHIQEVLKIVKEAGLDRVIVTGSGQHSLFERIEAFFPEIFSEDKMVTAYDVVHGKPSPEPYLLGLEKAGVSPLEAIVVENAPLGVRAARAAGIFTIAVNTGELTEEDLAKEHPNLILPDMAALSTVLSELLS